MRKIVLTSCGLIDNNLTQEFLNLFSKKPVELKVLYIPTAIDGFDDDDFSLVEEELGYLLKLGINRENITEYRMDYNLSINDFDFIYMMGGNTFYLLKKIKEYNFEKEIVKAINSGVVYVGSSAGSEILGNTIEVALPYDIDTWGLTDFTGLKIIDAVIIPHANRKKDFIKEQEKKYERIYQINDGHGIIFLDDKIINL